MLCFVDEISKFYFLRRSTSMSAAVIEVKPCSTSRAMIAYTHTLDQCAPLAYYTREVIRSHLT